MNKKEPRRELAATRIDMVRTVLAQLFPFGTDGIGTHPDELVEAEIAAQVASNLFRRAAEVHRGLLVSWKQMCDAAFVSAAASQLKESQDVLEPLLRQLGVRLVRQDSWRKGGALPGFRVANGAGQERTPECCNGCGKFDPRLPQSCSYRPERDNQGDWACTGRVPQAEVNAILDLEAEQPTTANESPEPSCCAGCVNSPAQCVHSPEEDGECVGRETELPTTAGEPEDLTALDGEPEGDEQPEICSECGRQYSTCGYQPGYQECEGFGK